MKTTPEKEKAQLAFSLTEEIRSAKQGAVSNFLIIGKNLVKLQEEKLWRYYGGHLQRFEDFLREIKIGVATAYNLMAIWRSFGEIITSKGLEVCYFSLVKLLPIVKRGEDKETWLQRAVDLTPQDFNDEIRIAKGGISYLDCPHEGFDYFKRCKKCNKFFKYELGSKK